MLAALAAHTPRPVGPEIRLLGGGATVAPTVVDAALYRSGRIDLIHSTVYKTPAQFNELVERLKHLGLYKLTQESLDEAIRVGGKGPGPSDRTGSGLFAIEFLFGNRHIQIQARYPDYYAGIHEVDVFLKAREAIRDYAFRGNEGPRSRVRKAP